MSELKSVQLVSTFTRDFPQPPLIPTSCIRARY